MGPPPGGKFTPAAETGKDLGGIGVLEDGFTRDVSQLGHAGTGDLESALYGRSIRTTSEFSRKRSNTICLPSGVMSNVNMAAGSSSSVSGRVFFVARSRRRKSIRR